MDDIGRKLPRREFVQAATLGLGASVLAGAAAQVQSAASPAGAARSADAATQPYDLIIVGAGTAGLPCTIEAVDLGARVLLLEKNPAIGGTLHVTGSQMSAANTRMQIEKGFEDSPSMHYRDVRRIGRFQNDPELVKLDIDNAGPTVDWLQDLGVEFTPESPVVYYGHEVYGVPRTHMPVNAGRTVLEVFRKELDKRVKAGRVHLQLNSNVKSLDQGPDGRVIGVTTEDRQVFRAGAVILATGGYGASSELRAQYNPTYHTAVYGGLPHATGDGIVMAKQLGARLVHMDNIIPAPGVVYDPKTKQGSTRGGRVSLQWDQFRGAVWVNKNGDRFVNEDGFGQDDKEKAAIRQPDMTFFVLFDEKARKANSKPIVASWTPEKFEAEAARGATVFRANSIEALARMTGIAPAKLKASIERYNSYVASGKDTEFGRDKMQYPIAEAPFYAIQTIGFFLLTMGGIKVNHRLQVQTEEGVPIPGLYAIGETIGNGQLAGNGLVGGMSVTPAYVFGRLSARYALDDVRAIRAPA